MILVLALTLAAAMASAEAPAQAPYHVYEIPAPVQPGVFRTRISDDAAKEWAIEQIQSISIYDNSGKQLGCELMRQSRLGALKKAYPLEGVWRDLEKEPGQAKGSYGPLNFAWRFAMPKFAKNESPYYLHFNWRSKVGNPGEVRLLEVPPPSPSPYGGPVGTHLMDGQRDHTQGHASLPFYSNTPRTWAPEIDLLFTLSQDELTIESPVLETLTKKAWTLTTAPGPGWIIFSGNGNVPYRLQLGETLYGCGGANVPEESVSSSDAAWPPELKIGAEIADAPHMGETQATWNKRLDQGLQVKAQGSWLVWGTWIGLAFAVALCIAMVLPRR